MGSGVGAFFRELTEEQDLSKSRGFMEKAERQKRHKKGEGGVD